MSNQRKQYTSNGQRSEKTTLVMQTVELLLQSLPVKATKNLIELPINLPVMHAVWLERQSLKRLSDEHLNDIGLDPASVRIELNRSFFDIPEERRKTFSGSYVARYEKCF